MKNDLFNQSMLKKYGKNFKLNLKKHDLIKEYQSKLESGKFKSETKNYLYFYDVILKGILGYTGEDVLFDEKQDQGTGKSEFVLQADDKKFMIIELKGQGIDLDKKQKGRGDNKSPVEQAFGYAIHTGDVDWIMVSNYDEFRLYNYHEKTKYISFNAGELLDKDKFSCFMLAFSRESHIESDYLKKIHEGTLLVDKKLASEFYKLYNETRLMLIKELETTSKCERLDAIHYAQLILNRYMFICFAEDTRLLPPQISADTIATPIQKGNIRRYSIWQRLNELFQDINEGNAYKKISEYNGGLFQEDLDFIQIRDLVEDQTLFQDTYQNWNFEVYEKDIEHLLGNVGDKINPIYKNMLTISSFDFSSELDVNILGHIFENSIGDIEELKADTRGRRKKEGIFYTPDYITDYICRNTIIPYLSKSGKPDNVADLIKEYPSSSDIEELDHKLKNIKIVDPACGSGAFLNKATDILLNIHEAIFNIKKGYTTTSQMRVGKGKKRRTETVQHTDLGVYIFDAIEKRREILIDNIFGVDLNEESVEITKLSLFLKVCRKDLKLPNLDKNIKNGNSLIDNPEYTDKPFNWEKEFPEIFKEGGFDVVIGNPPYVRHHKFKDSKPYLKDNYSTFTGLSDLYVYFFEKGINILKNSGMFAYICSNAFTTVNYGMNIRKFILKYNFLRYVDYTGKGVFGDVKVDPCIIILQKTIPNLNNEIFVNNEFFIDQKSLNEKNWSFKNPNLLNLKEKINLKGIKIKNMDINVYIGIFTGYNTAFFIGEEEKVKIIHDDPKSEKFIKPLLRGRDVSGWKIDYKNLYLLYIPWKFSINDYPAIKKHLNRFRYNLENRSTTRDGGAEWYALQRYAADYIEEFYKPKLIFREISTRLFAVFDDNQFITNAKCFVITSQSIDLKFLCTLFNSKLLDFVFKLIGTPLARTSAKDTENPRYSLSKSYIEQLPIYHATPEQQQPFIEKADQMLKFNCHLQEEIKGFHDWLQHTFTIDKLSKKLEKYYELSLDDFLVEVRKKKVNIKSRENYQSLKTEFEKSIQVINPLLQEISVTDQEIDQMVYQLYGLTDEEIKIIEDNI